MAGVVAAKLKLKKQQQEEEEAKVMVNFNETVKNQFNGTHINDHGNDDNDQVLTHHQQKQDTDFKIYSLL